MRMKFRRKFHQNAAWLSALAAIIFIIFAVFGKEAILSFVKSKSGSILGDIRKKSDSLQAQSADWVFSRINNDPEVACRQYDLPTFAPHMMKFIKANGPLKCWDNGTAFVKGHTIYVKNDSLSTIRCNFTEIYREDDKTHDYFATKWHDGPFELQLSDGIRVQCTDFNSGKTWNEVHAGARRLPTLEDTTGWHRVPSTVAGPINVLIWAFDSTSKNNFLRKLPKSWSYIRDQMQDSVLMDGYNVLGESTFSALCPIVTGERTFSGPNKAYVSDLIGETLFSHFRKRGYVTAFVEDEQNWGTFQHWGEGFRSEIADHYTRAYMLERAKYIGHNSQCCYSKSCNGMTQTYVQEFWETYSEKPKLSFTLQGTYSHDDLNKLDMIDDELLEYLIWLNSPKMRNETMIVIMADHGPRGHALTMTRQGTIELRRPMMNIMMPPWFKTKFPKAWENLLVNSKRLVTTLDLHYTIKSLLSLQIMDLDTVPVLQNLPPGLTMFAPMPKGRTCAMAQVQSHYCACKNVKEVSTAPGSKHSDILHKLAKDVIVELNKRVQSWLLWCVKEMPAYSRFVKAMETKVDNKTGLLPNADSYHPFCREWSLEKIERAHLIVASKGNQTKLDDDELEESVSLQYELTIVARPGPGHFLATVWHNPVTNKSTVDVYYFSRMDWFSPHAKCIERVCPSLEKYCYC